MIFNINDKLKDLHYNNSKSSLKANNPQDAVDELSGKVDQIANDQIPDEYLKKSVDEYVNENSGGFATQSDISQISSEIDFISKNSKISNIEFLQGVLDGSGSVVSNDFRISTGFINTKPYELLTVVCHPNYEVLTRIYSYNDDLMIGGENWKSDSFTLSNDGYYRFSIRKKDNAKIVPEDGNNISFYINSYDVDINVENGDKYVLTTYEQGVLNEKGEEVDDAYRWRSNYIDIPLGKKIKIFINPNYSYMVKAYDKKGEFIFGKNWTSNTMEITDNDFIYRIVFRKNDHTILNNIICTNVIKLIMSDYSPIETIYRKEIICNPYTSILMSDNENKIAHVSSVASDTDIKGKMYAVYYCDNVENIESPNAINEKVVACKFNISNPYEREIIDVLKGGETIGDFTFDLKAIREPICVYYNNLLYVFCYACVNNIYNYYCITLDNNGNKTVIKPKLDLNNYFGTMGKIINIDGVFYCGLGGYSDGYKGKIIKSTDLINWETFKDLDTDVTTGSCEEITIEYFENNIHAIMRISDENIYGIYHQKIDMNGNTIIFNKIENCTLSRPFLVKSNNCLFAFTNKSDEYNIKNELGSIPRSAMRISVLIDDDFVELKTVKFSSAIHYFYVFNYWGSLYTTFSSDVKKENLSQGRSEIRLMSIEISQ